MTVPAALGAVAWIVCLGGSLGLGAWLGRRRAPVAAASAAVLLGVVLFRWLLRQRPDWEDALFPFEDYAAVQPWWGPMFGLGIMGLGVAHARRAWLRIAAGVGAGMLLLASGHAAWSMAGGGPAGLTGRPDAQGICRQTSGYSCGAAAAATLLARIGVPADEREMARLCWTNRVTGTDVFPVVRGLRKKLGGTGRRVRLTRPGWDGLVGGAVPAMAVVYYSPLVDHWVVVLEAGEGGVLLGDPLRGRAEVSKEWFLENWRGVLVWVEGG